VDLAERIGSEMPRVALSVCLAQTKLAEGDVPGATAVMNKADVLARHNTVAPAFRARHAAYRVMFAIRTNDLGAAAEWGKRLSEYSDDLAMEFQQVPPRLRLSIALGQTAEAAQQLAALHEKVTKAGAHGLGITVRVYQALAAGSTSEALSFLSEALRAGEAEGYIRTFADEGKLLAPLLRQALSRGVTPEYTARLLNVIRDEERQNRVAGKASPGGQAPGPLSERELEILRLVEAGLSNRQIAERLVITLATVKTHVHNLSQKLNVRTRTQALARARELKLL